jgi:hypothetical protein
MSDAGVRILIVALVSLSKSVGIVDSWSRATVTNMAAPSAVICFSLYGIFWILTRASRVFDLGASAFPKVIPVLRILLRCSSQFESRESRHRLASWTADGGRPLGSRSVHLERVKHQPTHLPTTSASLRSAALSFTLLNVVSCWVLAISQLRTLHTLSEQAPLGRIWRIGFQLGRRYTSVLWRCERSKVILLPLGWAYVYGQNKEYKLFALCYSKWRLIWSQRGDPRNLYTSRPRDFFWATLYFIASERNSFEQSGLSNQSITDP